MDEIATDPPRPRILIILGHPRTDSFCHALARAYHLAAQAQGAEVHFLPLGEMAFDPVLRSDRVRQALEPDLMRAQAAMAWADHLAIVYPIWWGGMPALLKGFIDRTFQPGFAFSAPSAGLDPIPLLCGRTADLVVTMDNPAWYQRWIQRGTCTRDMERCILRSCGIRTEQVLTLGPVTQSDEHQRQLWLNHLMTHAMRFTATWRPPAYRATPPGCEGEQLSFPQPDIRSAASWPAQFPTLGAVEKSK